MMSVWFTLVAGAQEDGPIGEGAQGLVSDQTVDVAVQASLGLVDIGDCSGTLINRYWVLTAHHCLSGGTLWADLMAPSNFTIRAKWSSSAPVPTKIVSWAFTDNLDVALLFLGNGDFGPVPSQAFHTSEIDTSTVLRKYGRGLAEFASAGPFVFPAVRDGEYRTALFSPSVVDATTYTLEMTDGNTGHGGDSGGPDIVESGGVPVGIAGVQSTCSGEFVPGKSLAVDGWEWATTVHSCDSAPLYTIRDQILATAQEVPVPDWEAPDPDLFGHSIWLYAVTATGSLIWNRQDELWEPWYTPRGVGVGWDVFVDVVPAGGNAVFGAHQDGTLYWYRHDGYTTGTGAWTGGVALRTDWTDPVTIGGGEGVLYTIADDGTLVWHKYGDYMNGADPSSWSGPSVVGWGWDQFETVVSTGEGTLYAMLPNGDLWVYHHDGFTSGDATWSDIRKVGNGWDMFDHLVGLADDQLLGIGPDGTISWYRHLGQSGGVGQQVAYEVWEGPTSIGGGFAGLPDVFALMP